MDVFIGNIAGSGAGYLVWLVLVSRQEVVMKGRPTYKVVNADGWWWVMHNKAWDIWQRKTRHAREDLAVKQMNRMIRRERHTA